MSSSNKMKERSIRISSIDREKIGTSWPDDFIIKFNPPLKLDPEMEHEFALDRLSMTYSWYNIRSDYKNNAIRYTHNKGVNWETITFVDGAYSYSDINDYIHTWNKKIITQLTHKDKNSFTLTWLLFYLPTECLSLLLMMNTGLI